MEKVLFQKGLMGGGGHNCDLERVMESAAVAVQADVSCSSLPHGAINKLKNRIFFWVGTIEAKFKEHNDIFLTVLKFSN